MTIRIHPRDTHPRGARRPGRGSAARPRAAILAVAMLLLAGYVTGSAAPLAVADSTGLGQTTVKWAGGNDPAIQQYQPDRSAMVNNADGSGHWNDFKNLQIQVSQTASLTDQAVTVTISGMAASSYNWNFISNYVQLMQCWGPDPNAADFMQTCQYGSISTQAGASSTDIATTGGGGGTTGPGGAYINDRGFQQDTVKVNGVAMTRDGEPFRTVSGATNTPQLDAHGTPINGLLNFFTPATSNEQPIVPISSNPTTQVQFEVQSANAQPYLGCGGQAGTRCWLVAVPRGTHSGTLKNSATPCDRGAYINGEFGKVQIQGGSPLDRNCSFWADRMVVPLDFQPTAAGCNPGTPAARVDGTELVAAAVSSWQSALCSGTGGAVFSLVTNPGSTVRGQVAGGTSGLGLTLQQVSASELQAAGKSPGTVRLRYAPVANTAVTIAFIGQRNTYQVTDLKLSPRLIAKLLTMSYTDTIPWVSGRITRYYDYLNANNPSGLSSDPEFQRLNPQLNPGVSMGYASGAPQVVMIGPQGEDGVAALWRYLQADDRARAWLSGQPDNVLPGDQGNSGMTINGYFLPKGNPNALGGGLSYDLSKDPVDMLPKADPTLAPDKATADANYKGQRIDALMMDPYSATFANVTQRIFRGDAQLQMGWDPNKFNSANEYGAWVSGVMSSAVDPGKFLLGPTDLASAQRYGLGLARLQLPNSDPGQDGSFVAPTDVSVLKGLTGSASDDLTSVTPPDPKNLPAGAYPLATTVYAAANIDSPALDSKSRGEYGQFLDYAAGAGQTPGQLRGQLPVGYVPLTDAQRVQTRELAARIRNPGSDAPTPTDTSLAANNPGGGGGGWTRTTTAGGTTTSGQNPGAAAPGGVGAAAPGAPGGAAPGGPAAQALAPGQTVATGGVPGSVALGIVLVAGLIAAITAPIVLNRRRTAAVK